MMNISPEFRHCLMPALPLILALLGAALGGGCQKKEANYDRIRGPQGPVPATARIVREGAGKLQLKAPDAGVLYVYDLDSERVVHSQQVTRGQRFAMDPAHGQTMLDGLPVKAKKYNPEHRHRIYFDRARPDTRRR